MYEILKALEQMIKEFANQFANKEKELGFRIFDRTTKPISLTIKPVFPSFL